MRCNICETEFKNARALVTHISVIHKMTSKEYYDRYLRKPDEGICKTCGKPTNFRRFSSGYAEFCSSACMVSNKEIGDKRKQTIMNRSDTDRARVSTAIRNGILNCDTEKRKQWNEKVKKKLHENLADENKRNAIYDKMIKTKHGNTINKLNTKLSDCFITSKTNDYFDCQCLKCNNAFSIHSVRFYRRLRNNETICTVCNNEYKGISKGEKAVCDFIHTIYHDDIIENSKNVISDNKELDIYIPKRKLAIEFDGLYWHNEEHVKPDFHLWKTNECEKLGIQLIHIFEDEWMYKTEIVKSRLCSLLGVNSRIAARKTICKEISYTESKEFLERNHIQGNCMSKYRYGLFYNNELVSVMTFGKSRFKDEFELLRFANKLNTNVIGGAGKLFKHFIRNTPSVNRIISYADRRWSIGNLYERLNFKLAAITKPNYYYICDGTRKNRICFQKHKLAKLFGESDATEHDIMKQHGYLRIYDCGNFKYIWER